MSHHKYRHEKNCLNCSATVDVKFCPECGQENLELKENFFHLAFHVVADFFHYDSKFLRSFIPLFVKPGFLTQEYWAGRRVRYIHPLRLFFFVTIVFMISTTFFYSHFAKEIKGSMITRNGTPVEGRSFVIESKELPKNAQNDEKAMVLLNRGVDLFFAHLKYISFFLVPFFGLVFMFLYRKSGRYYTDFLVYVLHIQSFAYIVVAAMMLIPFIFPDSLSIVRRITFFIVLIYVTISLKQIFQQTWWRTVLKSIFATVFLFIMMGIVLGVYLGVSMFGLNIL